MQAEVNIGLLGHVDHGKTTLTSALSGKWTDTHSEEIKRGISIRLGYANANIYYCKKCEVYKLKETCQTCDNKTELTRRISFVDAPGHETLMTTVISASSLLDGALFLIAANEPCPQPQTTEHLIVLNSTGIKNIIIVQTKVDLISKEKAKENYNQIKAFLKNSIAENAPIVPVAANYNLNIENLIDMIQKYIPTPKRDEKATLRMCISRSFDVNKPGTKIEGLLGGVLGGSILQGSLKLGDMVEIKPGIVRKEGLKPVPIKCDILSLKEENEKLEKAIPGGLIAIGTPLDPALTKGDVLVGAMVSRVGELPEAVESVKLKYELLKRTDIENPQLKEGEIIAVNCYTATSIGVITNLSKGIATLKLKKLIVAEKNARVAMSRRIGQRWRLCGWGKVV